MPIVFKSKREHKKCISGSFVHIRQFCESCKQTWYWESQPFIGSIPAGNILMSAAILYSGSLPTKALRIFHILKCASITTMTYFRHQNKILQPAVDRIWVNHQSSLLRSIAAQNRNLFPSGDGRADSPGHSAKFGSYTVIDMLSNKVVDFKLVQVWYYTSKKPFLCIIILLITEKWGWGKLFYGEGRIGRSLDFPTAAAKCAGGGS